MSGPSDVAGRGQLPPDESLGELVSHLTTDLSKLTRQELALAKAEMQAEAKKAGKGAGMYGGAAFAGWMLALFVSLTAMWALADVMHIAWAALIVAAVWAVVAAILRLTGATERLMGKAESASSSATDAASAAASSVQDVGTGVGEAVKSAPDSAREYTRGAPLATGVVAFAAGWIVSAVLPPSAREREFAQQAKDKAAEAATPLKEQAAEAAQEIKDNLQQPAQEAVEHVRETTMDAAGAVADESWSAARNVADESKNSAAGLQQARSSDS